MRRTLTFVAVVIVLLGIAVAVYFFFFRSKPSVTVSDRPVTTFPVAGTSTSSVGTIDLQAQDATTPIVVTQRLVRISAGPVVPGERVVTLPKTSASSTPETGVEFIERQSGNVYLYRTQSNVLTRISNKTIPGIQSATWLADSSLAFVRYLSGTDFSTINTYALPSNGAGGYFLNQNISDFAVGSTSILTVASGANGSIASLANIDGTHAVPLFTSPLASLRIAFSGKQYVAFTKPSALLAGYAFLVDPQGNFTRIAGPALGLVALPSPLGKWVLVSSTGEDSALHMSLVDTTSGETIVLPLATIADKCVWAADDTTLYCGVPTTPSTTALYPDDWYQGAVSFSDKLWKVNVTGRYATLILDYAAETNIPLDATALTVDSANSTLTFINKDDGSLWSFSL